MAVARMSRWPASSVTFASTSAKRRLVMLQKLERRTFCFVNGVDSCMDSVSLLPAKRLKRLEVEGGRLAKYLTITNKI